MAQVFGAPAAAGEGTRPKTWLVVAIVAAILLCCCVILAVLALIALFAPVTGNVFSNIIQITAVP